MKLQRYNQFVKRINEERTSDDMKQVDRPEMRRVIDEEDYDSVDDFRREVEETDEVPMADFDTTDVDDEDGMGMEPVMRMNYDDDDADDDDDDSMGMEPVMLMNDDDDDDDDDDIYSDFSGVDSEKKLFDLAQMLGVEVVDNEVKFGDQVVNYYSETGNLHIGSKEFETAKEAADYLQGGTPRMMRDTNESRSYRFNRRRK